MNKRQVNPWTWQDQLGFSQAWRVDGAAATVFLAGQTPISPAGRLVGDESSRRRHARCWRVVAPTRPASSLVVVPDDALLAEQIDYYRARAGEYDRWWFRQGRFDRGPEANARWFEEVGALEAELDRFAPSGEVLELACGTGLWTRRLASRADRLTAIDASPEVLALNRERVGDTGVRYLRHDLFAFTPEPAAYDAVVFCFWLSHVPAERFSAFWAMVASALKPTGRVLFFDSARTERSTAADHRLPGAGEQTMTRRLDDGREFTIVKRFWDPSELERELARLGWHARVKTTGEFFIHGRAARLARVH